VINEEVKIGFLFAKINKSWDLGVRYGEFFDEK